MKNCLLKRNTAVWINKTNQRHTRFQEGTLTLVAWAVEKKLHSLLY